MNPYTELGLDPAASPGEIKKAYRRKAAKHHPDKGGKEEEFHRINNAYKLLSDPAKRARYDETGDAGMADEWDRIVEKEFADLILMILESDPPDVALNARQALAAKQDQLATAKRKSERELDKIRRQVGRVKLIASGSDPILDALRFEETRIREHIRTIGADTKLYAAVALQLERYEFQKKQIEEIPYQPLFRAMRVN